MNIFVNRVYGLELQADITDRELIVILQAHDRGLVRGSKVAVLYDGERRYLDVEAIDRARTLPSVVFSGYTMPPPPPLAEAQAAELPKRPVWGVFLFGTMLARGMAVGWRAAPEAPEAEALGRGARTLTSRPRSGNMSLFEKRSSSIPAEGQATHRRAP